jgi:hypothetical protein
MYAPGAWGVAVTLLVQKSSVLSQVINIGGYTAGHHFGTIPLFLDMASPVTLQCNNMCDIQSISKQVRCCATPLGGSSRGGGAKSAFAMGRGPWAVGRCHGTVGEVGQRASVDCAASMSHPGGCSCAGPGVRALRLPRSLGEAYCRGAPAAACAFAGLQLLE